MMVARCALQVLKEREALLLQNADPKKTAEMSQHIRNQLKTIREEIDELAALQKKEAKKARVTVWKSHHQESLVLIPCVWQTKITEKDARRAASRCIACRNR